MASRVNGSGGRGGGTQQGSRGASPPARGKPSPAGGSERAAPARTAGKPSAPGSRPARTAADRFDSRPPVARSTASNADRTRTRPPSPHARAGALGTGDGVFAGAAAIKGRDATTGIELETFSVSAQVGGQNEVQAGVFRVGVSSDDGSRSLAGEALTVRAGAGVHNADGSTGVNMGALAVLVGIEGTVGSHGNSLTFGASVSIGAEASLGVRDSDADGLEETCFRVAVEFITFGMCIEEPYGC